MECTALQPQVLAIGQFDGVHLGHRSVIQAAVKLADRLSINVGVMTFDPHPKRVLSLKTTDNDAQHCFVADQTDADLTPLSLKKEILSHMGVQTVYVVSFDFIFSNMSPQKFVTDVLFPLHVHTAVVGFDFRFGYQGEGNEALLRELGRNKMAVVTVPPFLIQNKKVSSSDIRFALHEGQVQQVQAWLGRPYMIVGVVKQGEKRGRSIGFPTANVQLIGRYIIPRSGVYAVKVKHKNRWLHGVMNIGVRPTFHHPNGQLSLEVHLLKFNEDLYEQQLTIAFFSYIRSETKFNDVHALIAQIRKDITIANEILCV